MNNKFIKGVNSQICEKIKNFRNSQILSEKNEEFIEKKQSELEKEEFFSIFL